MKQTNFTKENDPRRRTGTHSPPKTQQARPRPEHPSAPPGHRSASPNHVQPGRSVPPAELRRRRMLRQKRRRKRILLLVLTAALCLLLLAGLITAAVFAVRGVLSPDGSDPNAAENPPASVSDNLPDTTAAPIPAETEPPLPEYAAENKIDAPVIDPAPTDKTVSLSDTVSCPHAILINAETGNVIAEKNGYDIIYPASMTKLMTVLVAYEMIADLDTPFRMTQDIIDPVYLDGLSLAGFAAGETCTVRDLLYGSALPSGAEASVALAIAACGSEEAFVEKMNARAQHLGMFDTHFENCTGAHHPDHVSTLSDIGVLIAFMMQNEELAGILGTYRHTTTPTVEHPEGLILISTVFSRMEGSESGICTVLGGKTGYTAQGGQCLATCAVSKTTGERFVCVTAGGETKWRPVYDSIYLYQFYTTDSLPESPPPSIMPTE